MTYQPWIDAYEQHVSEITAAAGAVKREFSGPSQFKAWCDDPKVRDFFEFVNSSVGEVSIKYLGDK